MFIDDQPFPHSVEKLNPQLPFQIGQGRAYRGLGQRQHLRGLRRRPAFQHFGKNFQLTQRNVHGYLPLI